MDDRTRESLRRLNQEAKDRGYDGSNNEYVTYRAPPAAKKPVTYDEIRDMVIPDNGYTIEASPNYNPNTGRLETDRPGPVRMFEPSDEPSAFKFDIKYNNKKKD